MKIQKINSQQYFGTNFVIDAHQSVQREVSNLPNQAKIGIEVARRILAKNGRDNDIRLFCANDTVGWGACANYWGLEIKPLDKKDFGYFPPQVYNFEVFEKKSAKQVAKVILDGYKNLAPWGR